MRALVLLLVLLVAAGNCPADVANPCEHMVVRVSLYGVDEQDHDGSSWSLAKRTIQAAIDYIIQERAACPSECVDEVWVAEGVYGCSTPIQLVCGIGVFGGFSGDEESRSQSNWHRHETILDGTELATGEAVVETVTSTGREVLQGFTIQNASCGVLCASDSAALVTNNLIKGVDTGVRCEVSPPQGRGPVIANNIITDFGTSGIDCGFLSDTIVANNTIVDPEGGFCGISVPDGGTAVITSNIIVGCSMGVANFHPDGVTFKCNNLWDNVTNCYGITPDETNILENPLFEDRANGDYRLMETSPCIDVGWDETSCEPLDFYCEPRSLDIPDVGTPLVYVDIGACEYSPLITPVVTDDGGYTNSATELHATWTSANPGGAVDAYYYAIGTGPGLEDVVPWTSNDTATEVTVSVSLTVGTTYYFAVKAYHQSGIYSGIGYSDGITCIEPDQVAPLVFDPYGGRYKQCATVQITCDTPDVDIYYTLGTQLSPPENPTESTGHLYNPDGEVIVRPPYGGTAILKAAAFKEGWTQSPTRTGYYRYEYTDPPETPTCWKWGHASNAVVAGLRVAGLFRVEEDNPPNTTNAMRIAWYSGRTAYMHIDRMLCSVKRKLANDPRPWEEVEDWDPDVAQDFIDDTAFTFGTHYKYAVKAVEDLEPTDSQGNPLPPCTHEDDDPYCHPAIRFSYTDASWTEIDATAAELPVAENQTVDSRGDTRYVEYRPVNFQFQDRVYRGGLYAGYVPQPDESGVGRSFVKFSLPSTESLAGSRLWASSFNAYYMGSYSYFEGMPEPAINVGCQFVSDDSWVADGSDCITWETAPSIDPASPQSVVKVGLGGVTAGNWCTWTWTRGNLDALVAQEIYGDGILSLGLARTNETETGWAYFAKTQYNADLTPTILYAYGSAPVFVVGLELSPTSVVSGGYATGTVHLNAPAPAGGLPVYLKTSGGCRAVVPHTLMVEEGQMSASFTVSTTTYPPCGEQDPVTINAGIEVTSGLLKDSSLNASADLYIICE